MERPGCARSSTAQGRAGLERRFLGQRDIGALNLRRYLLLRDGVNLKVGAQDGADEEQVHPQQWHQE